MGAPIANQNAVKSGRHSKLLRLPLGELPKSMSRVTRTARAYRRDLEADVMSTHGDVTTSMAHAVDEAATCQQTIGVSRWLLRHRSDKLSVGDATAILRDIRQATAQRNRAVASLRLDQNMDPWAALDAIQTASLPDGGSAQAHATTNQRDVKQDNSAVDQQSDAIDGGGETEGEP